MIDCIFTLDYELYGDGAGSLKELVYEPAEKLKAIFENYGARFVIFVETGELEIIEGLNADHAINLVRRQISDFYARGYELGLHVHPQWYNAQYENNRWLLDYVEYNLCNLAQFRIDQIISRAIEYLRKLLGVPDFTPISFRAGNWLLQPTWPVSKVLAEHGLKIDSSVYKGGMQHLHRLDYRRSQKNGYFWRFSEDVNIPDHKGVLIELPTYTRMVPLWNLFSRKRIRLQQKGFVGFQSRANQLSRIRDITRLRQPMKLDFCRLTISQLIQMFEEEIQKDQENPGLYRPIVAIGHTKDLIDYETPDLLLSYLRKKRLEISIFGDAYRRIKMLNGSVR